MRRRSFQRPLKPVETNCPFCKQKKLPDYKEVEMLRNYLTERGKILGKDRTGLCSKHQRQLSTQIKRARFLGLLPFTVQVR
ncbi:30S ribosomal protein S18 [Candidatus Microgenomates bacterium]|nr:MAG: 30S ribosomal protein S18 [Candidatus Microgenomates bacterium]